MKKSVAATANGTQSTFDVKKLVVLALLSAIGYVSMLIIKIPVIGFLKYEPKDIFITFAGFLYGPLAAFACSVVTAVLELPISSTGPIGMVMNIISSSAFACTAALIYQKRRECRDIYAAAIGLVCSAAAMSVLMLLWNYLISPLYMGISRAEIAPKLTAMFLPFNLLKAGINATLTLLLYRPFLRVLHLCGYPVNYHFSDKKTSVIAVAAVAALALAVCIGVVMFLNRS